MLIVHVKNDEGSGSGPFRLLFRPWFRQRIHFGSSFATLAPSLLTRRASAPIALAASPPCLAVSQLGRGGAPAGVRTGDLAGVSVRIGVGGGDKKTLDVASSVAL